jgi:hypothetical protein
MHHAIRNALLPLDYRDYPVVMASSSSRPSSSFSANMIADLLYAVSDPRIRLDGCGDDRSRPDSRDRALHRWRTAHRRRRARPIPAPSPRPCSASASSSSWCWRRRSAPSSKPSANCRPGSPSPMTAGDQLHLAAFRLHSRQEHRFLSSGPLAAASDNLRLDHPSSFWSATEGVSRGLHDERSWPPLPDVRGRTLTALPPRHRLKSGAAGLPGPSKSAISMCWEAARSAGPKNRAGQPYIPPISSVAI